VLRALGLMFVSTFLLAAMHATIRHLSEAIHPFEIAIFRSLFALAVVAPWFYRDGRALLQPGASVCIVCARSSMSSPCSRSSTP
jgi:drug/metabolite transporter (DMT)-like permease